MKQMLIVALVLCGPAAVFAQNNNTAASPRPAPNDVEALRQQVQALTETVKTLQEQVQAQQDALAKMNAVPAPLPAEPERTAPAAAKNAASPPPLFPTTDSSVVAAATTPPPPDQAEPAMAPSTTEFPTTDASVITTTDTTSTSGTGASLAQPITIAGGGKTYMNISFDGQFALAGSTARDLDRIEVGDHDPQQRGFNARNLEIALDGAVDPYFQGFANIVFKLDNNNETEVEVEEAFMQTTSLPFGLQLKGGQFFAAFGRINPMHPHTWDFADDPLVHGRLLGPDGLRGVGAQISWTAPVSWYS